MKTPKEVIAYWLWTEADAIDFDDMGERAGQAILDALNDAGYIVAPVENVVTSPAPTHSSLPPATESKK